MARSPDNAASQNLTQACQVMGILSDPTRLQILLLLASGGERNVGSISEKLGLAQSQTSHHLRLLRLHHLVVDQKVGQQVIYSLEGKIKSGSKLKFGTAPLVITLEYH